MGSGLEISVFKNTGFMMQVKCYIKKTEPRSARRKTKKNHEGHEENHEAHEVASENKLFNKQFCFRRKAYMTIFLMTIFSCLKKCSFPSCSSW